jgi:sulfite exporter TauE/SafE
MIGFITGWLAGMVHVISGPDHMAAVAPLSLGRGARAWKTGLKWGLGHASGVFVVGILSLLLREALPVQWLSSWAERLVGIVLIAIGTWGLRHTLRKHVHAHEHSHGESRHVHIHAHSPDEVHAEQRAHVHTHAAFAVGTLHGLAGSSHFLGVVPALAFPTRAQAIAYLVAFGLGTVVAMCSFSTVLGWLAERFSTNGLGLYRGLMGTCSVAALAVGSYWLLF